VGIVRDDHAPAAIAVEVEDVAGAVVVEVPGLVVAVVGDEVAEAPLVDVDVWVVDVESEETARGASTSSAGRSLTWASAALTICHVNVVATAATSTQAPAMLHLLTCPLSQEPGACSSTNRQGFLKAKVVGPGRR
jgi:hypothetical protein